MFILIYIYYYSSRADEIRLYYGDFMRILENRGNWYKGNLHMHTTMSDGVLDPVEAINVYREAGYDFIAITDHRKIGHPWQDGSFLILPGVEWDTGDAVHMPVYHILGIGMDRETVDFYQGAPYEGAPLGNTRAGMWVGGRTNRKRYYPHPQAIIEAVRAAGGDPRASCMVRDVTGRSI